MKDCEDCEKLNFTLPEGWSSTGGYELCKNCFLESELDRATTNHIDDPADVEIPECFKRYCLYCKKPRIGPEEYCGRLCYLEHKEILTERAAYGTEPCTNCSRLLSNQRDATRPTKGG